MWRHALLLFALSSAAVTADDSGFDGVVAVASAGIARPYPGAATDHALVPVVIGRWRTVHFQGNRVLAGLYQGPGWSLAALGQLRLHQYLDAGDVPGVTAERRSSFDLGAVVTVPVGPATVQAAAMRDASGAHRGAEYELRALAEWSRGPVTLVPGVAWQRQDRRLAGYYFDAGATTNVMVEVLTVFDLSEKWNLLASVRHFRHGDAIARSDWVDARHTTAWALGIGRRF